MTQAQEFATKFRIVHEVVDRTVSRDRPSSQPVDFASCRSLKLEWLTG
jgi:hypothetical protein